MIASVVYSTDNFETMRKRNAKSAHSKGKADIVFEFTPKDIDNDFKEKNKVILSNKRGAGLWLWKPYFINKVLLLINEGDYLIYSDAGSFFVNQIKHLINALELSGQDIMVFELPLISKQWTKQETFVKMGCDKNGFEERNQIMASFLLLKKTKLSEIFIKDYLTTCCDEAAIDPRQFDLTIENPKEYLQHRADQSILSILSMKYGLKPFRDPSQLGYRPWEYIANKEVIYCPAKYENSAYPTIFLHTRKDINYVYLFKETIKKILSRTNFYINWEMARRNRK